MIDDAVVIPYAPRQQQRRLHYNLKTKRWAVVVCHRRFGKTVWAINHLLRAALTSDRPEPRYAYFAPYLKQAKSIAWDYLKHFSRPIPGININETELRIDYPNGARIRLLGADNPDSQRGVYLDGVVLDEYAQMAPAMFSEILRPALSDRSGWCVWMGTPKGRNHFYDLYEQAQADSEWHVALYRASDTGILDAEELRSARKMMSADEYDQEYECSWQAALKGAYFAAELADARTQGRITRVPAVPHVRVNTWWDLGMDDSTAIWFSQDVGREIHLIDYYEASGEGLAHYRDVLDRLKRERGYHYDTHYGPHDLAVRELGTGKSRIETAFEMGLRFEAVPRVEHKADAIQAARNLLTQVWIDETRCARGLVCLESYRKEWDDKLQVFREKPLHDWACFSKETKVLTRYGMRQMIDLPKTGEVLTPCGFKPYRNAGITGKNAQLVEVRLNDGSTVRCTPEHKWLTESGWKSAEYLMPGTLIQSFSIQSPNIFWEAYIGIIRVIGIFLGAEKNCIVRFGKTLLAKFHQAIISIISTTIQPIIVYPIYNAFQPTIICQKHGIAIKTNDWKMVNLRLIHGLRTQLEKKRLIGIVPKKAGNGINNSLLEQNHGQNGSEKKEIASFVKSRFCVWLERMVITKILYDSL